MWKEEARNTGGKAGEKNRERKNSRRISAQEILEVKESIWERKIRKNVYQEAIEPCNTVERGVCAKEGKSVFTVKKRKRGDTSICEESTVKGIYSIIKIATNSTSPFCSKEGWQEKNGTRLSSCKPIDNKEWVPLTLNCKYPG